MYLCFLQIGGEGALGAAMKEELKDAITRVDQLESGSAIIR